MLKVLLTGSSGYVGGRLVNSLTEQGHSVRCLVRDPARVKNRFPKNVEIAQGDVLNLNTLEPATKDIHTAYYLIHSMGDSKDFEESDRTGAKNFADSCKAAGVKRIIYLGGLGESESKLSSHLRSRQEVGQILKAFGGQVIEFRASIVIGSGSLSFEMVRALTERLPIMITPRWVRVKAQPIGIQDLLSYLTETLTLISTESLIIEIGGKDVVSYGDLMREYARQRGLKRLYLPMPFLSPKLSSYWLRLVTPLYARVGHKLITSIKNETIVHDSRSKSLFSIEPIGMSEAVSRALSKEDYDFGNTCWSDALSSSGKRKSWAGVRFGSRIVDSRTYLIHSSPLKAFAAVQKIGGDTGWYFANFLWKMRGYIDMVHGGPGLRRGRRDPVELRVGDILDFWRVEAFEPGYLLRLHAEMHLPGRAWLEFTVTPNGENTELRQTAIFDPIGVLGRLYWYGLYPLHYIIFNGMLRNLAKEATRGN